MIKVEGYQCEYCGELFSTEDECSVCENEHIKTDQIEITEAKHHNSEDVPCYNFNLVAGRFPHEIIIEKKSFSGTAAKYKLVAAGSVEDIYDEEEY